MAAQHKLVCVWLSTLGVTGGVALCHHPDAWDLRPTWRGVTCKRCLARKHKRGKR